MSSNREVRQELERVFGKVCMIEELGIRYIPKDKRRKLKGYTKSDDALTYHHIKEKHFGGTATLENGALIRGYNHRWLHSLEPAQREKINQAIQKYKLAILSGGKVLDENGNSVFTGGAMQLDLDADDFIETPIDMQPSKRKSNRAKEKKRFKRKVAEAMSDTHEDSSGTIFTPQKRIYTPRIVTASDEMKMILRSALKNRAQEIVGDISLPDDYRKDEFEAIEAFIQYINDFEVNQEKLAELERLQQYISGEDR